MAYLALPAAVFASAVEALGGVGLPTGSRIVLEKPFGEDLDSAIRLNAALRFQARNDSDFQNLAEDPRFTELLYPDPGAELGQIAASSEDDR